MQAGHRGLPGGQHQGLHLLMEGRPRLLCPHPQVQTRPDRFLFSLSWANREVTITTIKGRYEGFYSEIIRTFVYSEDFELNSYIRKI